MFPNVESLIDALYEAEEIEQQQPETEEDDDDDDDAGDKTGDDVMTNTNGQTNDVSTNGAKKKNKKRRKNKKKNDNASNEQPKAPHVNPFELMEDSKGTEQTSTFSNVVHLQPYEECCCSVFVHVPTCM